MPSARHQQSSSPIGGGHRSLTASLEDFEASSPRDSPVLRMPSQHSGFGSPNPLEQSAEPEPSEYSLSDSTGPWSPPAWRRRGTGWFEQHDQLGLAPGASSSPSHSLQGSRQSSPGGELMLPASVALPPSPDKGRSPENSPEPDGLISSRESSPDSDNGNQQLSSKNPNCKCRPQAFQKVDQLTHFRSSIRLPSRRATAY